MKLYNSMGPNPQVVRTFMAERGIELPLEEVDIMAGVNRQSDYLEINPAGQLPALQLDDGTMLTEITVICEYLDKVWPETSLHPADPYAYTKVRYWSKALDEELHPACGELTFAASHRHTLFKLGEKALQEFLDSTPDLSVTARWHERKKELVQLGFDAPRPAQYLVLRSNPSTHRLLTSTGK